MIEIYLAKFPSVGKLLQGVEGDPGGEIVARLMESRFYRITPKWIRMIDNSKGFGHKEELIYRDGQLQSN